MILDPVRMRGHDFVQMLFTMDDAPVRFEVGDHIHVAHPPVWAGPDWTGFMLFFCMPLQWSLHLCFVCLAVRPSAHLGWTGPDQAAFACVFVGFIHTCSHLDSSCLSERLPWAIWAGPC
jgi:hypothetical protein